ncbi:DNA-3-methyladenine glycosylase [Mesoplasma entomophilum]|uniref:DNA-3-methyladenine glycosylase I n=1 Tax=Mesoplasma entomophilum TaxID=2149 RepID=A0A3S5XYU4_9MOLU|nr:DNA-3-methyladenine glycosylase I [Mesoplasma entomophilum]ATQ35434.1 DNA-3-methyladenine glycosylase I [Mesoplasma entomophilum]ATZ19391.1 DNA-3-methyladenine glycosylase [Mesoplasma entomophilum]
MSNKQRCDWSLNEILNNYHDNEWGKVNHNDDYIFEILFLENMQAGLNWLTILLKRKEFKKAFDNLDYKIIAKYDQSKFDELITNSGIIRNKLKIKSASSNAIAFINVQKEYGSFDKYIWSFTNNKQIVNNWKLISDLPSQTELSVIISKDLKSKGFKFVGPVIVYSFLQAIGIIDDHLDKCFCKN